MQAPGKGQFQAGIPTAQASGVNVAANDPVPNALGNTANAIENAGNLAQELEQEQERQYMAQAEIKMSKASADLQLELVGNANPQDHVDLAREKYDSLKADVLSSGRFNPRFEQLLSQRFDLYAGKNIEKIALNSRLLQVENGKKLQIARAENYREQGDFESQRSVIKEGTGTYWSAEEERAAMMKIDRAEEDWKFKVDLNNDPEGVAEKLKDKSYRPEINPLERIKAQEDARRLIAGRTEAGVKRFQDGLATGEMGAPEKIDEAFGPSGENLRPSVIERMKGVLAERSTEEYKAKIARPDYQNEVAGKVSAMLDRYNLQSGDSEEQFVDMDSMIRELPTGAMRDHLSRKITNARAGKEQEVKTVVDQARKTLKDDFERGTFGQVRKEQSAGSAIDAGLLRDRDKLKAAGFNDDSLEYITGKNKDGDFTDEGKKLSDTERRKRFVEKYPQRISKKTPGDAFLQAAFESIQRGDSSVSWMDEAAQKQAEQTYGKVLTDLEDWAASNPDDAKNPIKLGDKIHKLTKPYGARNGAAAILPPLPVFSEDLSGESTLLPPPPINP